MTEPEKKPPLKLRDHMLRQTMLCQWPLEERQAIDSIVWAVFDSVIEQNFVVEDYTGFSTALSAASEDMRRLGEWLEELASDATENHNSPVLAERLRTWAYKARSIAAEIAAESRRPVLK